MSFTLDRALMMLERTPAALDAALRGLPDDWVGDGANREDWDPRAVVGHLIHGEIDDWVARGRIILNDGEARPFTPFDRMAQFDRDLSDLDALLDQFARLRADNVATVRGWQLDAAALARSGRHPELGVVTLAELIATWTVSDLAHLAQIRRWQARRYREAVGPWRAFFRALRD